MSHPRGGGVKSRVCHTHTLFFFEAFPFSPINLFEKSKQPMPDDYLWSYYLISILKSGDYSLED